jgi:ankyrin repeat protein
MTGQRLCEAALDGDAAKVSTLLSTQGAWSFINYQCANGWTPLLFAAQNGHSTTTEKLLAARCSVDLQAVSGCTALQIAASNGHEAVTKQLIAAR